MKYILIIFCSFLFFQTANADISSSIILNPPIDDSGIISNVQSAIDLNPELSGESITVTSNHGVVTLEGEVSDLSIITVAINTALVIDGVIAVRSDLTIEDAGY